MSTFVVKEHIKEQLKKLPMDPGIYIMKDKDGNIIYVGKSKHLRNRVSSYFRGFDKHQPKTQTLVTNIADFEYIITDSETEALILEANLIKKHQPRFNILLKDDKMYPYIQITTEEDFPRVLFTRQYKAKGKSKFFGPFTGSEQVRQTIEVIQTIFPIRECSKKITSKIDRPCLNYHIGRCAGACNHQISKEEYGLYIDQIIRFLNGDRAWLIDELTQKMQDEAARMNFERAAEYRDKIMALNSLNEKQKALQTNDKNQDYIAFYNYDDRTCVMVFQVRGGKIEGRESYNITGGHGSSSSEILSSFILQYYSGALDIPKEIYLSDELEGMEGYGEWLSNLKGHKVIFAVPQKGEKKKTIDLVSKNAKEYIIKFQERVEKEEAIANVINKQLHDVLGMPINLPLKRIEAYDISNTSGVYSVGSMVVFENGKKKRSDYRRYRVKTVDGPDDYASMQEVLYRRFRRGLEEQKITESSDLKVKGFSMFPDLLLIDGGKGHVNAVKQVLTALKINIPVAGMVKDDFHKTDDLYYEGEMKGLKSYTQAFRYVYSIQEEVHRFAIEYHKSIRSKEMTRSILNEIEGVGEKRRIALMKHFKSIESIQKAEIIDLLAVEGINQRVAEAIYQFFRDKHKGTFDSQEASELTDL